MAVPIALEQFDFELPPGHIAQEPVTPRDASRLLMLDRQTGVLDHRIFHELPSVLRPGDLLVVNQTRVVKARLRLHKQTGAQVELLLMRPVDGTVREATTWTAMGKPGKALGQGAVLCQGGVPCVEVISRDGSSMQVRAIEGVMWRLMQQMGEVPLPPYIEREIPNPMDEQAYQTIFAKDEGAVAAPTASLHFTSETLKQISARGIAQAALTLHVGPGTFLPVRSDCADDIRRHPMHPEWYEIPDQTIEVIEQTKAKGGRIVAVGTTSVRALESWAQTQAAFGDTCLFIYPGFTFKYVDAMLTNFHLPKSTLLMLVSAFAGRESVLAAYGAAIAHQYRFFSYGDAMLIA